MITWKLDYDEAEFIMELVEAYQTDRTVKGLSLDVGAEDTLETLRMLLSIASDKDGLF